MRWCCNAFILSGMDLQLTGKTALVTGSTAGIGFAICAGLAREGARVVVNGRTTERTEEAAQKLRATVSGADVLPVAADLSTEAGISTLLSKLPTVDILINNLGIFEPKDFFSITDADWERFFQVNVMSGVRLSRAYLPSMLKQNSGRIIFISSESGIQIPAEMIHYGMTKTAQLAVSRGLAEITTGTNVTVNCVLPGPTASEGVSDFVSQMAQSQGITAQQAEANFFKEVRPTSLIKRFATPTEVANLVVFIASPLSSATNGANLRVDGGVVRAIV